MAHDLDWNDLRFLVSVARAGSQKGAARALGVALTTVSRRVEQAESDLGLRVFDRTPDGMHVTDAGRQVLEYAFAVEAQIHALRRHVQGETDKVSGEVRVSTLPSLAERVVAPALAPLAAYYPELRVLVRSEVDAVSLARREADLALRIQRPKDLSLIGRRVGKIRFGLYAAQSYLDAHGAPEDPATTLAGHHLVAYEQAWAREPEVAWVWNRASEAHVVVCGASATIMAAAVRAGAGIGMLPTLAATDGLVQLLGPEQLPSRDLWLVLHEDLKAAPAVRVVADCLAEAAARTLPAD